MLSYHFEVALRGFGRDKVITALMVMAVALGIGASMTVLTIFHVLSGDPLPGRSQTLFYVQVDANPLRGYYRGVEPETRLTRFDAEALYASSRASRQAIMYGGSVAVHPPNPRDIPFYADARYTSPDFFSMFETPFRYGQAWSAAAERGRENVTVIGKTLNDRLFGGANSVGRTLQINDTDFRVVGVLDAWRPVPKFYDLYRGSNGESSNYSETEDVFLPYSTAIGMGLKPNIIMCFGRRPSGMQGTDLAAPCTWAQLWVQLNTPNEAQRYRAYLESYSDGQRTAGRFERPNNIRLRSLLQYLDFNHVVPRNVRLQLLFAFAFLFLCLVNTGALILAKFLLRSAEIGTRRALGASRRAIFAQHLVESATIGLAGGFVGLGLTAMGLWVVRQQPVQYADIVDLDWSMLALTFALAISSSTVAGLLPAWRVCRVTPAFGFKDR